MHLDLTDEQTSTLIPALSQIVRNDRYPLSPRIVALKEILGMFRPGTRPRRCRGTTPTDLCAAHQGQMVASPAGDQPGLARKT
jgi:hypothetical protein